MAKRLFELGTRYVSDAKDIRQLCLEYCQIELERSTSIQDIYGVTHYTHLIEILKDPIEGLLIASLFQNVSHILDRFKSINDTKTHVMPVVTPGLS